MSISFRVFRHLLLGAILIFLVTSLALALYLRSSFNNQQSVYVIMGIVDGLIIACTLSMGRKSLWDSPQSVAMETLGLCVTFPFALILALYLMGISVSKESNHSQIFLALQIFIVTTTVLHTCYTFGLAATAAITVCAFDADVWIRDIDQTPSPFPMTVLLRFVFPCLTPNNVDIEQKLPVDHQICLPGCNCSSTRTKSSPLTTEPEPTTEMRLPPSSSSLVRIPNDVERRTSIVVAFEV